MKKILIYLPIVFMVLFASSCQKDSALKDVNAVINKLNQFNKTYEKLSKDGVISKEKAKEGDEKSEFDKLRKIAKEYYDLMNQINNKIKKEKESDGDAKYEQEYLKSVKDNQDKISKATELFKQNLEKIAK